MMFTITSKVCTLFCLVMCVFISATVSVSSADNDADIGPVNRKSRNKKLNSLRIHYPYKVFSGEKTSNWRDGSKKSVLQLPKDYFNLSRSQDQEDLWLYENWFYNMEGGVILEVIFNQLISTTVLPFTHIYHVCFCNYYCSLELLMA